MRKFFYSISVILFLGLLTFGYYETYRLADMRDKIWLAENSKTEQSVRAEEGDSFGISFAQPELPGTVVMADGSREKSGYGSYYLKEQDGFVQVYLSDKKTVFENTSIQIASLPELLREEIRHGKYLKDQQELYSFLENYSS